MIDFPCLGNNIAMTKFSPKDLAFISATKRLCRYCLCNSLKAGLMKKASIGATDMIAECMDTSLPEPDFEQHGLHFVVTLRRDWLTDEVLNTFNLNDMQLHAVSYVKKVGRISNSEHQKLNGYSPKTAARDLGRVEKSILICVGERRAQRNSDSEPNLIQNQNGNIP